MAKIKCPGFMCGSTNCTPLAETGKKYKTGKGLAGGVIGAVALGPVGGLVGAASGFNGKKKVKFMCNECGKVFEVKL